MVSTRKHILFFISAMLTILLASCRPSLPSHIISESDMEDILYDYHIASCLAKQDDKLNEDKMYSDILDKYGITQAKFDSSMVYYTRHYRLLKDIYNNIEYRMSEKIVAMGGNVQDLNSMGEGFSSADTTNFWNDVSSILFLQYAPYSVKQFELKADTAYKAGDKMLLSFDTEFIVQDGRRDLVAMLAIRLKNDSVAFTNQHFSSPMHATLTVGDDTRLGIKSVSGFIVFTSDPNDTQTTTKLAFVRNIKLIRMHTEDPNKKEDEAKKEKEKEEEDMDEVEVTADEELEDTTETSKDDNKQEGKDDTKKKTFKIGKKINGIQKAPLDRPGKPAINGL